MKTTDLETKINACGCPKCGGGVAVTVELHLFGKGAVKAQCSECEYKITTDNISFFPTPIEIAKCISSVLSEWNNKSLAQRKPLHYEEWRGAAERRGIQI